jgi:hypothetical protein
MFIVRLTTLVLFINNSFALNEILNSRVFIKPSKKIPSLEYCEETWDDGEVAWELKQVKDEAKIVLSDKSIKLKNIREQPITNREKNWGLVENLRVHGAISGVLNVAYYNTAVSDNIINDFQNFKITQHMSFVNIISANCNNILDVLLTLFTIIGYNIYKKTRIQTFILACSELYENNYYINEFREFRKISTTIAVMILVVFSKSVQNSS